MSLSLLLARSDFASAARSSAACCKGNAVDWVETQPATGGVFLANIKITSPRRFAFTEPGIEAAVIEALAVDGETVVDLVAWPVDQPDRVLTMFGACPVLGEAVADNPATYFMGAPLRLHRLPLTWLQSRCDGVVLLHLPRAARWLVNSTAPRLAAEDQEHAAAVRKAMLEHTNVDRIVVPSRSRQRIAA